MGVKDYGYTGADVPAGLIPGRIVEARRDHYLAATDFGELRAVLQGAFVYEAALREDLPCVGDFVLLKHNESGASRVVRLLPRRSVFARADFSGHGYAHVKANRRQIVAANFDYVFIVTSLNKDFNIRRVTRYLAQTEQSGGQPVIILTKADLAEDFSESAASMERAAPGVPVHAVSSRTGVGVDALDVYLKPGKTVVFLGMSGVGKSSLLNALLGSEAMAVGDIREDDSRGRHTTTHRHLFVLPSGAMVIDTPGMRELGLTAADEGFSDTVFSDIEELFTRCRFSDCAHGKEPGCAVKAALADGSLTEDRWNIYLARQKEMAATEDKSAFLRGKREKGKALSAQIKDLVKKGKVNR